MPYLTGLANVARRTGYPVTEVSGWKTRGHGEQPQVLGVVCHHTAGATAGGDYPSLNVVAYGRSDLKGPLSQLGIGRSGRIYVIAAGRSWHNAPSTSNRHTNSTSIGIEAENDGRQAWPPAQVDAYKKLCAELCREYGIPTAQVKAHREVNTGKPDPHSFNMTAFRRDVAAILSGDYEREEDMPTHAKFRARDEDNKPLDLILPPSEWRYVPFTHKNGKALPETYYSVLTGPALYSVSVGVRFHIDDGEDYKALPQGTEVQLRLVEVVQQGSGFTIVESAPIDSPVHVSGSGHFTYTWTGNAQKDHRVRLRVSQHGPTPARIDFTEASVLSWKQG